MAPKDDERVELRVPTDDLKRWRMTAGAEGLQLSEWIRRRCNEVAVDQEMIDVVAKKLAERRALQHPSAVYAEDPPPRVMTPAEHQAATEERREATKRKLADTFGKKNGKR